MSLQNVLTGMLMKQPYTVLIFTKTGFIFPWISTVSNA